MAVNDLVSRIKGYWPHFKLMFTMKHSFQRPIEMGSDYDVTSNDGISKRTSSNKDLSLYMAAHNNSDSVSKIKKFGYLIKLMFTMKHSFQRPIGRDPDYGAIAAKVVEDLSISDGDSSLALAEYDNKLVRMRTPGPVQCGKLGWITEEGAGKELKYARNNPIQYNDKS